MNCILYFILLAPKLEFIPPSDLIKTCVKFMSYEIIDNDKEIENRRSKSKNPYKQRQS